MPPRSLGVEGPLDLDAPPSSCEGGGGGEEAAAADPSLPPALRPLARLSALSRLDLGECGVEAGLVRSVIGHSVELSCW